MGAAELGHGRVVSLLLKHKANVNAANKKGRSALSFAAPPSTDGATRRESQILVMDILLSHGADVHMKDITGKTALERAQIEGHTEVAAFLKNLDKKHF